MTTTEPEPRTRYFHVSYAFNGDKGALSFSSMKVSFNGALTWEVTRAMCDEISKAATPPLSSVIILSMHELESDDADDE